MSFRKEKPLKAALISVNFKQIALSTYYNFASFDLKNVKCFNKTMVKIIFKRDFIETFFFNMHQKFLSNR